MIDERRERTAADALAGLRGEIKLRSIELAALERAADILERSISTVCDAATLTSTCAGPIGAAWCRACGFVVRRCERHGGNRAVAQALHHHGRRAHGGTFAAPTDDEIAVLGGGETLPMDFVPAPQRDRGEPGDGGDRAQRPDEGETDGPGDDGNMGGGGGVR